VKQTIVAVPDAPMAPDEMNESESTKKFVVPDHLIAGMEQMKGVYPEASDEELASTLKYS